MADIKQVDLIDEVALSCISDEFINQRYLDVRKRSESPLIKARIQAYGYQINQRTVGVPANLVYAVTRDFSRKRELPLPPSLHRKAQAEEYESNRQQATYVTPRELKLAERFKKEGRIPSDPLDKLRMEYGLMWQCYEVDKSTNPPSAKQRGFPSKEELTRCRLAILHPEEIDRIVIGSDLKFIPKSEFYKDWNESLRFAHKFNQPKEKGQLDTHQKIPQRKFFLLVQRLFRWSRSF